ncbi:SDR family oxidoreductase [Elusimicrobiota bacterium]
MSGKVLLLGHTGKMGTAIIKVFKDGFVITGKSSADFNALEPESSKKLIEETKPDIVINAVAFLGIDPCEKEAEKAFSMNALFPRHLAELSNKHDFLLVHFSTDAVFNDKKGDFYVEKDMPQPLNVYGSTKYSGDCLVQAIANKYYIFRIPVLFGETVKNNQFVEKMFQKAAEGSKCVKVAGDIMSVPTYSYDVACEIKKIIEKPYPFGLYHIANSELGSLYDLMKEIADNLNSGIKVEKASFKDFPYVGIKNTYTPIRSEKLKSMRPWKEAVKDYCSKMRNKSGG